VLGDPAGPHGLLEVDAGQGLGRVGQAGEGADLVQPGAGQGGQQDDRVGWRRRGQARRAHPAGAFQIDTLRLVVVDSRWAGAGDVWRGALHSLHLAVAGGWLGTVVVLAIAVRGAPAIATLAPAIARFSPWALACAALAFVSGTGLAWLYLGSVSALVETRYGRLLLLKLALIAAVGVCGFLNWQRVRRRATPRLGWIQVEAALAVLTVAMTAWLTETEHP